LKHYTSGNGNEEVLLSRPDGTQIRFSRSSFGTNWSSIKMAVLGKLSSNNASTTHRFLYTNLSDETEVYDTEGRLTELRSVTGQKLSYTYNSQGELTEINDDFGRHLTVSYSGAGALRHVASVSDGARTVSYQTQPQTPNSANLWAGRLLLKKVTYPDSTSVEYLYDEGQMQPRGLLTGIIKEDGQRYATYLYDDNQRVMQTEHGEGLDSTDYSITPGEDAFVGWQGGASLFPLNNPRANGLSKTSGSSAACPNCGGTQAQAIGYDSNYGTGAITSMTTFDGVTTDREVDQMGRPISETVGAGTPMANTVMYSWHGNTRLPATVYEPVWTNGGTVNRMTTYDYDAQNRPLTKTVQPFNGEASRAWTLTYNLKGQVETSTVPGTGTITHTYDATSGNLLSSTNPMGHTTTYGDYTPQGKPGKVTDPNGLETVFTYDARDRVTQIKSGKTGAHWETLTIAYTAYGNVQQITRPDGTWTKYAYDSAHGLIRVEDPRGKMILTLNNNGDVIKQEVFDLTNTLIQRQTTVYDSYRRVKDNIDANNKVSSFLYWDSSETLLWQTDPDQPNPNAPGTQLFTKQYDSLRQPASTTSGMADNGRTTQTAFSKTGQMISATDGNYVQTGFSYNAFGEMTEERSPDAGTKMWARNNAGQVTEFTDGRGAVQTTDYDAAGRPTQRTNGHPCFCQ